MLNLMRKNLPDILGSGVGFEGNKLADTQITRALKTKDVQPRMYP